MAKRTRAYLPATEQALDVLGSQIAIARRELKWGAAELAERLGVDPQLVGRIERGAPGTAIGTVFEAAVLCGVPLFGVPPEGLRGLAERQRAALALLPATVRSRVNEVSDDF
jgi:transcriptional regulator with XRE-family HTH domain